MDEHKNTAGENQKDEFSLFNASGVGRYENRRYSKEHELEDKEFYGKVLEITELKEKVVNNERKMRSAVYRLSCVFAIVLVVGFGFDMLSSYLASAGTPIFVTSEPVGYFMYMMVKALISYALPTLLIYLWFRYEQTFVPKASEGVGLGLIASSFFALYFLSFCGVAITSGLLGGIFGVEMKSSAVPENTMMAVTYYIFAVVISPICEEMIYRRFALSRLRRFGDFSAVMITALLFGIGHGTLDNLLYSFLSGMILGFLVIWTDSIIPSIAIHALYNIVSILLSKLNEVAAVSANQTLSMVVGIVPFILIVAGAISLVYMIVTGKFRVENSCPEISSRSKVGMVAVNVVIVLSLAMIILFYVLNL